MEGGLIGAACNLSVHRADLAGLALGRQSDVQARCQSQKWPLSTWSSFPISPRLQFVYGILTTPADRLSASTPFADSPFVDQLRPDPWHPLYFIRMSCTILRVCMKKMHWLLENG